VGVNTIGFDDQLLDVWHSSNVRKEIGSLVQQCMSCV